MKKGILVSILGISIIAMLMTGCGEKESTSEAEKTEEAVAVEEIEENPDEDGVKEENLEENNTEDESTKIDIEQMGYDVLLYDSDVENATPVIGFYLPDDAEKVDWQPEENNQSYYFRSDSYDASISCYLEVNAYETELQSIENMQADGPDASGWEVYEGISEGSVNLAYGNTEIMRLHQVPIEEYGDYEINLYFAFVPTYSSFNDLCVVYDCTSDELRNVDTFKSRLIEMFGEGTDDLNKVSEKENNKDEGEKEQELVVNKVDVESMDYDITFQNKNGETVAGIYTPSDWTMDEITELEKGISYSFQCNDLTFNINYINESPLVGKDINDYLNEEDGKVYGVMKYDYESTEQCLYGNAYIFTYGSEDDTKRDYSSRIFLKDDDGYLNCYLYGSSITVLSKEDLLNCLDLFFEK